MKRQSVQGTRGGAIVIGGDYRGLGVVRSLGRRGIPVWVLTDNHRLAAFSRYATRSLPWPETDQVNFLLALCAQYSLDSWVVIPTGDEAAALLSRHHAVLKARLKLTVPTWDVLRYAYDKRLTYRLAADLNLAYPWTCYPQERADLENLHAPFPVILKPAIKEGFNSFVHDKAWEARDRAALLDLYDQATAMVPRDLVMAQEMIPGDGTTQFSYAALCKDGEPLVSIVARRTRQYPTDFGRSSTFVESVDQPQVEKISRALLAALGYTGLVEIEFKRDPRDGEYKLLDINPRVWGWHTLGRRFGGDFAYLLWQLMQGEPVTETRVPAGLHWVRGITDIAAVAQEMRQGRLSLGGYLRSFQRPLESAIFAFDDLLPALIEAPLLAQLALRRKAL
ncbi:MAG: ATP-grasp domain-containing protein [Chloroflexi bacterium]|nr:ATP-grasp domain-containing protein [Chloroflexota bacterium]